MTTTRATAANTERRSSFSSWKRSVSRADWSHELRSGSDPTQARMARVASGMGQSRSHLPCRVRCGRNAEGSGRGCRLAAHAPALRACLSRLTRGCSGAPRAVALPWMRSSRRLARSAVGARCDLRTPPILNSNSSSRGSPTLALAGTTRSAFSAVPHVAVRTRCRANLPRTDQRRLLFAARRIRHASQPQAPSRSRTPNASPARDRVCADETLSTRLVR